MSLVNILIPHINAALNSLFSVDIPADQISFQKTRKDFEGDITVLVFPFVKMARKSPEQTGEAIGAFLLREVDQIVGFNVVKGFLNLVIEDAYWVALLKDAVTKDDYGFVKAKENSPAVMVEYSSPNTNKPLHLGHIRNNLLGYSVAEIIKASGKKVAKVQIINDRGIHICKSMLAWQKYGEGETPESTGIKGDHLVGKYYVAFDKVYKQEIETLLKAGKTREEAEKQAPILLEAQEMLIKWEAKDTEVIALWKKMNAWVYSGFESTYKMLGVDFDKNYYESDTYLLGKAVVQEGLEKGVFTKKEDGSVWCDLTADGLDEKIVLRSDGTAVYMTQDIGTAIQRFKDFNVEKQIYTVGNEQDYHFKVLFLILEKLGYDWATSCHHLSYGMVDLPTGKMKSREGTVVDADDLIEEMISTAASISEELGKLDGLEEAKRTETYNMIGLGALKYYMLKVDPRKRMMFDPKESIDFNGNTGSFIQYTHARIQSILRRGKKDGIGSEIDANYSLEIKEKELIKQISEFPEAIQIAAAEYSPAQIANYTYDLVKQYNQFYQACPIVAAANEEHKVFRVALSGLAARVIANAMSLLGIQVPERM
jgi:arginyl-tRNA synthetase